MIRTLGAMVDASTKAHALVEDLARHVEEVRKQAAQLPWRPRVYFEEWDDPMICGIRWVSELVEIAGGVDVFAARSHSPDARGRFVSHQEVIEAAPDVIIGSWCGKKFVPGRVMARLGFSGIPAVRHGALHEIKSALILQPGPAALTDGLDALHRILCTEVTRSAA